jgi:hypothetical protein
MKRKIPENVSEEIRHLRGAIKTLEIPRWWERPTSPDSQGYLRQYAAEIVYRAKELERAVTKVTDF